MASAEPTIRGSTSVAGTIPTKCLLTGTGLGFKAAVSESWTFEELVSTIRQKLDIPDHARFQIRYRLPTEEVEYVLSGADDLEEMVNECLALPETSCPTSCNRLTLSVDVNRDDPVVPCVATQDLLAKGYAHHQTAAESPGISFPAHLAGASRAANGLVTTALRVYPNHRQGCHAQAGNVQQPNNMEGVTFAPPSLFQPATSGGATELPYPIENVGSAGRAQAARPIRPIPVTVPSAFQPKRPRLSNDVTLLRAATDTPISTPSPDTNLTIIPACAGFGPPSSKLNRSEDLRRADSPLCVEEADGTLSWREGASSLPPPAVFITSNRRKACEDSACPGLPHYLKDADGALRWRHGKPKREHPEEVHDRYKEYENDKKMRSKRKMRALEKEKQPQVHQSEQAQAPMQPQALEGRGCLIKGPPGGPDVPEGNEAGGDGLEAQALIAEYQAEILGVHFLRIDCDELGEGVATRLLEVLASRGAPQLAILSILNAGLEDRVEQNPLEGSLTRAIQSGNLRNLQRLAFYDCELGGLALEKLAQALSPRFVPELRSLTLFKTTLATRESQALGSALGQASCLEQLEVLDTEFGDEGVVALAQYPFPKLTDLWLDGCGIRDTGAKALAESLLQNRFPELRELSLQVNEVGVVGGVALGKAVKEKANVTCYLRYQESDLDRGAVLADLGTIPDNLVHGDDNESEQSDEEFSGDAEEDGGSEETGVVADPGGMLGCISQRSTDSAPETAAPGRLRVV